VKTGDGKGYLEVDGQPYYYSALENWGDQQLLGDKVSPYTTSPYYSTAPFSQPMPVSWLENVFEKTKAAGFNTMQIFLKWNEIEPTSPGVYDWSLIDQYITWAQKYDLRLDLVWTGSIHCGGARLAGYPNGWMTWIPAYLQDRDRYFGANPGTTGDIFDAFIPDGGAHSADAAYMYQQERNAVGALFAHLASYDVTDRTIVFQVLNEPNMSPYWTTNKGVMLGLIEQLAEVVKSSDYVVATRVNLSGSYLDSDVANLPSIDMVGADPYVNDLQTVKNIATDTSGSRLPHIGENDGSYANTSSLAVTAVINGGAYNVFQLNDHYPDQGIYDPSVTYKNWVLGTIPPMRESGQDMTHLNTGLNKIGALVAVAPPARMAGFNVDTDYPSSDWNWWEAVGPYRISMTSTASADVGFGLNDGNYVYVTTDSANSVTFKSELQPIAASSGHLDSTGSWVVDSTKAITQDGWYAVTVGSGEVVRLTLPPATTPSVGQTIWLQSQANGDYVSAWLSDANQPLQAHVTSVQDWEKFTVVDAGAGYVALRSYANGDYVGAWVSDTNAPLQARTTDIGDWQRFRFVDLGGGAVGLQAYGNGLYVGCWLTDANSPLEARTSDIQGWQYFNWGTA